MIKRKYIKRFYIEEAICDKCGSKMIPDGIALTSIPEKYPYHCSNKNCDYSITFIGLECPGRIKYELEEEENDV